MIWFVFRYVIAVCVAPHAATVHNRLPLSLDQSYVKRLSLRCLDNIATAPDLAFLIDDSRRFTHTLSLHRWGSGCSGTDAPGFAYNGIADALHEYNIRVTFRHIFSAEISRHKRRWIQQLMNPHYIFDNVFKLYRRQCTDVNGKFVCPYDEFQDLGCYIAGFVCKSVSNLNTVHSSTAGTSLTSIHTQTGSTFLSVRLFLQRVRPKTCILENVRGLDRDGQLGCVIALLAAVGYHCYVLRALPPVFGLPQDRFRFYFVCFRDDLVHASGLTSCALDSLITRVWTRFQYDHPLAGIDAFIQHDASPYIQEHLHTESSKFEGSVVTSASSASKIKWYTKHLRMFGRTNFNSNFLAGFEHMYPQFMNLPARVQELLDARGCGFPHHTPEAWNCSQTTISGGAVASTVLPGSLVWFTHRCRRGYGRDMLGLQGIFLTDHQWQSVSDISETVLTDLAGNAFCIASCTPVQLLVYLVLSHLSCLGEDRDTACARVDQTTDTSDDDSWINLHAKRRRRCANS